MGVGAIIVRHGIVASLLAGLCVAGLPVSVGVGECQSKTVSSAPRPCCCQGKCGGHCHMACCQRPAPPQDRTPAPTKPVDDSHVWGLAVSLDAAVGNQSSGAFHLGSHCVDFTSPAASSLLSLGVRINA